LLVNISDFSLRNDIHKRSFRYIQDNLSHLDYKSVRDLLKLIIEKINSSNVPVPMNSSYRDMEMFEPIQAVIIIFNF
jgi:hypothetical protein